MATTDIKPTYKAGKRVSSYHKTEIEAAIAYNILAKKLHGEFAVLNIIKEGK